MNPVATAKFLTNWYRAMQCNGQNAFFRRCINAGETIPMLAATIESGRVAFRGPGVPSCPNFPP